MIRAQIVLDELVADRLRVVSAQTGESMSEIVRQALSAYFEQRTPDTGWIGALRTDRTVSHDLDDIRASVAAGRRQERKR